MIMGENEICREYRTAKNKKQQIYILADLNCCKPQEIMNVLIDNGEAIQPRKKRKIPDKESLSKQEKQKTTGLPPEVEGALYEKLDSLDKEIKEIERQLEAKQAHYKCISDFIMGGK